ncbi:MAG: hypothetical protein CBE00_04705 [Planctomycetaceae bacterium TMED240]|nr:hypothetical protein [Rhodopirellula sp.]OUX07527.1 MAG: hypothetical protein CBE00_04705 [Planctomycetaceae bacterium TMED240]
MLGPRMNCHSFTIDRHQPKWCSGSLIAKFHCGTFFGTGTLPCLMKPVAEHDVLPVTRTG